MSNEDQDLKIIKVGGSILKHDENVRQIVDRLARQEEQVVVVASALKGTTDLLIEALERVPESPEVIQTATNGLRRRHLDAVPNSLNQHGSLANTLDPILDRLSELLYGISYTGEVSPRTRDHVLSFGERLSVRVISHALAGSGVPSKAIDSDSLGVITDGEFFRATVDIEATTSRAAGKLQRLLADGFVPIITGYFGRDRAGNVITFGRGGTDYSGAILARVLNADELIVWKDVEGFLTTDPERIEDARPIRFMTYDEAAELAYLGVQVLHPRTLDPLREADIPIRIQHYNGGPDDGTRIGPPRKEPSQLRAVGAREGFGIVRMRGSAMAYESGVGRRVFTELSKSGVNVVNMAASQATFALLIDGSDLDRAAEVLRRASIPTIESVTADHDFALVCIVGRGIGLREGVAGRVFTVIGKAGVTVNMISVGSSNVAMSFVVPESDLDTTLIALHDELLDTSNSSIESWESPPSPK